MNSISRRPKVDNLIKLVLINVEKDKRAEVREALKLLMDELYDSHLSIFATMVKWLSKHIKSLDSARLLTDNVEDAMALISLMNKVKSSGHGEIKMFTGLSTKREGIYSEQYLRDMEEAITTLDIEELKGVFDNYLDEVEK